jgi:ABC-2 type transport system ATP-binding protein
MNPAIDVDHLCKTYKIRIKKPGLWGSLLAFVSSQSNEVFAVKDISFKINSGERVGLIGENGAGKSTTLKMLTGILVPQSGKINVLGRIPWKERQQLALNIGVVFGQRPQLLWDIPVRETFQLLKTMYRIPDSTFNYVLHEALHRLHLEPLLSTPVRLLSLGQRMRCDLAAALLHAPSIAFLDEPTIGLDVSIKEQVREFIQEINKKFNSTLIITTHDLKDITQICKRLIVLDHGTLLFDGSLKQFENQFAQKKRIIIETKAPTAPAKIQQLKPALAKLNAQLLEIEGKRLVFEYLSAKCTPELTKLLLKKLPVVDLSLEKPDIENLVTQIYKKKEIPHA